jgi:hypothetical protein
MPKRLVELMRRLITLVVGGALLACAAPHEALPPAGDPRLLTGTWDVVLRRGEWTRLVPFGGAAAHGRLTLRPSAGRDSITDATSRRVACAGCLRGTFRLAADGWLPDSLRGDTVSAAVFSHGRAIIMLEIAGDCGDCGNLVLEGRPYGNRMSGRWYQEFLGDGPKGAFVLRRVNP